MFSVAAVAELGHIAKKTPITSINEIYKSINKSKGPLHQQ